MAREQPGERRCVVCRKPILLARRGVTTCSSDCRDERARRRALDRWRALSPSEQHEINARRWAKTRADAEKLTAKRMRERTRILVYVTAEQLASLQNAAEQAGHPDIPALVRHVLIKAKLMPREKN